MIKVSLSNTKNVVHIYKINISPSLGRYRIIHNAGVRRTQGSNTSSSSNLIIHNTLPLRPLQSQSGLNSRGRQNKTTFYRIV